MDLSAFEVRYRNDEGGAPAYAPALLLKIILLAYSRGLVSSRTIESACRQHVVFMAVCGGATPHFTTLAAFVSAGGEALVLRLGKSANNSGSRWYDFFLPTLSIRSKP